VLTRNARRVRPLLELLIKLDLQGDSRHPARDSLGWIEFYHQERATGYTSATYALERLGAAARLTPTYTALTQLGQLWPLWTDSR